MIKASLKKLSVATFALLVLLLALSPVSSVVAQGMGHAFSGTVKIDGGDAAVGTVISAQVAGTEYGSCTVTTPGSYALIIQGDIAEDSTIHFYVDSQEADQTFPFHDGWTTELELTVTTGPPIPKYAFTITADPGVGGAATDETGGSPYAAGAEVSIKAVANPGYGFVGWTAPAGYFDDATAEETTFTMPAQAVTVTAHFGVAYVLTLAADPVAAGDAIDVGAKGAYAAGATVSIKAVAAAGYGFVDWTADPTVPFDDETAEETTFTMPAQAVTVTAHFEAAYALTMTVAPTGGGSATDLTNASPYAEGTVVTITAAAAQGYRFDNWTATAGEFGDATAAETAFTMPAQAATVTAHFVVALPPPNLPTVATLAATGISSYSGSVHMSYTLGNFDSVEVRFACKRPTDPAWFYSIWVPRTADGNYTEVLTGLVSQTQYQFKGQLKYSDAVIEGDISQFMTGGTGSSGTDFNDLLAYFGCFIATAAYGTPTAQQIDVLREFRDVLLLKSTVGSQFVTLYYRLSPPVADFVARSDLLRTLVRELLVDPIVWIVEATDDIWRN
jgi:uncharacterized repeat protein (TIGR02543 family)